MKKAIYLIVSLLIRRDMARGRMREIMEKFQQKGATSPDKAMTVEELELDPTTFNEMMQGRLGQSGIFVEVEGKYYLNEERLKEMRARRGPPP